MTTRVAATLGAVLLLCSVQSPSAQESRLEPRPTRDLPERYSRQVAPTPSTFWRSPDRCNRQLAVAVNRLVSNEGRLIHAGALSSVAP